jgi:hypothetical protein
MGANPQQLGQSEVCQRRISSELDQTLRTDDSVQVTALFRRPLIAPDQRRPQNLIVLIQENSTMHLAGQADASNI